MRHRTQLYLDNDQYRWLQQRARVGGSIAGVVRDLIDAARSSSSSDTDPFLQYLLEAPPARGKKQSTVRNIDQDLYGS